CTVTTYGQGRYCGTQNRCGMCTRVAALMLENMAKAEVAARRILFRPKGNNPEVLREAADFAQPVAPADQKKFILVVELPQRAHHVADVGAHAEVPDRPDVNGDPHANPIPV